MRKQTGVSMVTLVISIVVMIIILSIVINSSINSVNETNLTKIDNEIGDLKNAVAIRITNYQRNSTLYPIVGQKINDNIFEYVRSIERLNSSEIGEIIDEIVKDYSSENSDYYRLVGKVEAEKLGIENIESDHYYVVDYINGEVYGPVNSQIVSNGG